MVVKQTAAKILIIIGKPAAFSTIACLNSLSPSYISRFHLIWALPMAIITLPLLPAYITGERFLIECEEEQEDK